MICLCWSLNCDLSISTKGKFVNFLQISSNHPATHCDLFKVFCTVPGLSLVHLLSLCWFVSVDLVVVRTGTAYLFAKMSL